MNWITDQLKETLFPRKCVGCGKLGEYVCRECEVGMWEEEQICPACRRASRYGLRHKYCKGHLEGLVCLWNYDGLVKKIIKEAKYRGWYDQLKFLISNDEFLNKPEFSYFKKFLDEKPLIVPVPLFKKRLMERGFNQAEIIAKIGAGEWGLGVGDLLVRVKDTGQQVGRTREERLKAMEGAFALNQTSPLIPLLNSGEGKILLVDDVWTTGATMSECAMVLKMAGVEKVWGWVLAR